MSQNASVPASKPSTLALITHDELLRRLGDPALTVVNVLPGASWETSRIPGSISLPLADIERAAPTVLSDRAMEIVLYCASPT